MRLFPKKWSIPLTAAFAFLRFTCVHHLLGCSAIFKFQSMFNLHAILSEVTYSTLYKNTLKLLNTDV